MTEKHTPGPDPYEVFEAWAELYYKRYGRLAPGKNEPAATGRDSGSEVNRTQWHKWQEQEAKLDAIRALIIAKENNAALLWQRDRLVEAVEFLFGNFPDLMIEEARHEWGNTNTHLVEEAFDKLRRALAEVKEARNE